MTRYPNMSWPPTKINWVSWNDLLFDSDQNNFFRFFFRAEQISAESKLIFEDVTEEFCELEAILSHFEAWRDRDMGSYRDSYFSLCLPKVKCTPSTVFCIQFRSSSSFFIQNRLCFNRRSIFTRIRKSPFDSIAMLIQFVLLLLLH